MTLAARAVLADARLALDMLQAEADPDRWRVHWVGGAALLRAVGHVLLNVDHEADPELARVGNAAHRRWRSADPAHVVYREFILEERNNILKEYRSKVHPLDNVPVAISLTLVHAEASDVSQVDQRIDLDENLFRPLVEGYGEGEDARDVFAEAINWWERELAIIEQGVAETRRR